MLGIDYLFDEPLSLIVVVWSGIVTADDWHQHAERQIADPLWRGADRWLADLRAAEIDPSIGVPEIDEIADRMAAGGLLMMKSFAVIDPRMRWQPFAAVEVLSGRGIKADVCPDVGSALDWIGIPYEDRPEIELMLKGAAGADPGD